MPTRKTPEEINAELVKLRAMKPNLIRFSKFGDDHHGAMDAVIAVLQGRMTADQVEQAYGEVALGEEDFDQHILDEALMTQVWMAGEGTDVAPSSPDWWGSLVKPVAA